MDDDKNQRTVGLVAAAADTYKRNSAAIPLEPNAAIVPLLLARIAAELEDTNDLLRDLLNRS